MLVPCEEIFLLIPHLAGMRVECTEVRDGRVVIEASTPEGVFVPCPDCRAPSGRVHSRYGRRLADAPCGGRGVVIELSVRRLFCDNSKCRRVTFAEQIQGLTCRSALALKLLTSTDYGAIATVATFGLPECAGGPRNRDYRCTWIRDASLTAATLLRLGFTDEPRAYLEWVLDRYRAADEPGKLQIMHGIDGRRELTEQELGSIEGYKHSTPVRIGNAAYGQLQLDIYGELLDLIAAYDERVEPVTHELWEHLRDSADWVADNWRRPDDGIWEVRGGRQEFLYSRLLCWVALDRACRIAGRRSLPGPHENWSQTRDTIYNDIHENFWDPQRQAFVQHRGSANLDASTLLMPLVGGDLDSARLFFDKMQSYSNHLGLYAEEVDKHGYYTGNFPQAFAHVGHISTALSLDHALSRSEA